MLKYLAAFLFLALPAFAAETASDLDQKALLDPVPAAAQSETTTPQDSPSSHRFAIGLGSGMNTFGGNIGKLYSSSMAVADLRADFAISPLFTVRIGGDMANYSFNAAPNGAVNVDTDSLQGAAQYHFLSTAMQARGFDPYASLGMGNVFRTQTFQDHNSVEKDNAFLLGAGVGTNYLLKDGHLGFWAEADASQVFFQDRYDSQYLESGLEDMKGLLYSARLGVKYLF